MFSRRKFLQALGLVPAVAAIPALAAPVVYSWSELAVQGAWCEPQLSDDRKARIAAQIQRQMRELKRDMEWAITHKLNGSAL